MFIKIALLLLFFAVTIFVGFYAKKKSVDVNGFLMGGRSVGPWLTAFAYGTSYFSAVIFIGYAGQFGWRFGLAATWIGIGNTVIGSFLAWKILAKRTRLLSHYYDSATMPDYFGKRFESKGLKIASSIIVFVFLIPYTASLFNGLSRLFNMAFHIDYIWCVLGMAVLTAIYVIAGGYMATAINDFIQGLVMLVGIVVVVAAVIQTNGGFPEAIKSLSLVDAGNGMQGAFTSFFGAEPLNLLFVVLLTSLGTWGLPQMVQKFYAIKDHSAISRGTTISTIFALIVAGGCYFLGGFGRLYTPEMNGTKVVYDSIVPQMVEKLSPIVVAIVVVLVLSASMSTLSSLVLTSASTLTLDLIQPLKKKQWSNKAKVTVIRAFVAFFIAVSSIIAIIQVKFNISFIAQMMGISWGALAGAFLAPYLYSLFSTKVSRPAVWTSFIAGAGIMVLQMVLSFAGFSFKNPVLAFIFGSSINCGVVAMALGLVLVPLVGLVSRDNDLRATAKGVFTDLKI